MIEIRQVIPSQYVAQAKEMAYAHWDEVGKSSGFPPPELDVDQLPMLEKVNMVYAVCPFHGDEMVGYSLTFLAPCFNFKGTVLAVNEAIYVKPEFRGITSLRLMRATEYIAKGMGAHKIQWHTYMNTDAMKLFEKLGYHGNDLLFTKEL